MSLALAVSGFNRRRKWSLFLKEIAPSESMRILDVGFSDKEFSPNDNFIEKHYPYLDRLTALGVDAPEEFPRRYPDVQVVQYSGERFPFRDKEFDVAWSNAVIEHVGGADRQLLFLKEITRVSKKAFITTPNRYFPVEVHTSTPLLHFLLPKRTFDAYLNMVGKGWAAGDYMHLLSVWQLRRLLRQANITRYKLFKNRLLGVTLDFVVIVDGAGAL